MLNIRIDVSDYIYGQRFEDDFIENGSNIYYCRIDYVSELLRKCYNLQHPFKIVTHNGDNPVTKDMLDYISANKNFICWYGQNVKDKTERLFSLPIGLENPKNWTKFSKIELLNSSVNNIPSELVYANFSLNTNPTKRNECLNFVNSSSFVTNDCSYSTNQEVYEQWIDKVLQHHYVLCPDGNGIDTHRLWETLYLDRIPIVKNSDNIKYYENLPILIVDDWKCVTEELLLDKLKWFSDVSNFDLELLKYSYWINKINETK